METIQTFLGSQLICPTVGNCHPVLAHKNDGIRTNKSFVAPTHLFIKGRDDGTIEMLQAKVTDDLLQAGREEK